MRGLSRRRFLRAGAASAALLAAGGLEAITARVANAGSARARGWGPLVPDSRGLIDLPAGFDYGTYSMSTPGATAEGRFAERLVNGNLVPAYPDAMGAFPNAFDSVMLVRNHDLIPGRFPITDPTGIFPYDKLAPGGCTNLVLARSGELTRAFASLSGTLANGAGGPTPWNTWLSAEQSTQTPGPADPSDPDRTPEVSMPHGFVFEVDPYNIGVGGVKPIPALGRFRHGDLAVDPATGFVYLAEERDDGLLYRFRPAAVTSGAKKPSALGAGDLGAGTLEALRIVAKSASGAARVGQKLRVDWVPIAEPNPASDAGPGSTRAQGRAHGAATFAMVHGVVFRAGMIEFFERLGGRSRLGRGWRLDTAKGTLAPWIDLDGDSGLDAPGDLALAPNGDLVVCESGENKNYVVGLTNQGTSYQIARNAFNESKFAGVCFSPDRSVMFVNLSNPGITYAIHGPWSRR